MSSILIGENKVQYNDEIKPYGKYLIALNNIIEAYGILNFGSVTGSDFISLVENTEEFLFDKMTFGKPIEIMGLPVNKAESFKMFSKPSGYAELFALITDYKQHINWDWYLRQTDVKDGEIVLSEKVLEAIIERHKIYAKTDNEKNLFQFVNAVVDAAKAAFGEKLPFDLASLINETISIHNYPEITYTIRASKITGFREPGGLF